MEQAVTTDDRGQGRDERETKVPIPKISAKAARALRNWLERQDGKED